jgi:uncharacterized protein (DUF885 family)
MKLSSPQAIAVLCCIALLSACSKKTEAPVKEVKDSTFAKIGNDFIMGYLAWRPQVGTYLGVHEHDGKVTDLSKASIDLELERLKGFDQQLEAMKQDSLSPRMFYDYRILLSAIRQEIFRFENLDVYRKNPMTYASMFDVNIYIQRDFAPIEQRLQHIINIEMKAPAVFAAARANLYDSLPKPYVETAMAVAGGAADFLEKNLVTALKGVGSAEQQKAFDESTRIAVEELRNFVTYLKTEKLPKANNNYAIGKENYSKMLLYNEMLTRTPEEILEMGMTQLKKEQAEFAQVAKIIDPKKDAHEVFESLKKDHPKPENLISEAKKNVEAIRQFLVDKRIITIPSEVRVEIKETPQYARATSTASMDTPGPFETKATQAFYYITPTEKEWSAEKKEEWLSLFNYFITDIISIHEAYPGHYVQFLHVNASDATKIEKIFGSYAFIEGWAHYTEKMMIDEGFGAKDPITAAKYRLAQLDESLLRLCRLCVSVKMHCEGMTVEEGTKFIMDNAYYEYTPAYQESIRGTFDPGYLSYTLGKLQILQLREDYKKQEGENFSLQKFHDLLLSQGMPPVELARELMIK